MSNIKRPFLIISMLLLTGMLEAQHKPFPDSIKVEFPQQRSMIVFQLRDYRSQSELISSFPGVLNGLCDQISKSLLPEDHATPHRVDVRHSQEGKLEGFVGHERFRATADSDKFDIRITGQPPTTSLVVNAGTTTELLPPGWELNLTSSKFTIYVYAPDLNTMKALAANDLTRVVETLKKESENVYTGRKGITARLIYESGQVTYNKIDFGPIHDMIGIHAGAGIGLFRDKFYPELNFSTALYFRNRFNLSRQRIELSYELKFFSGTSADGSYSPLSNSFLNLSYSRNFTTGRPRWNGLGLGYLINSKGDVYEGKTLKFFLDSDLGNSKLNLVPEFYLTNDFKDFNFGLKLQYKF